MFKTINRKHRSGRIIWGLGLAAIASASHAEAIVDQYFPGSIVSLPDYIAQAEGYFDERGVEIELLPIASGPQALAAALGGTVNIFNTARTLTDPVTSQGECVRYVSVGTRSLLTVIARPGLDRPNAGAAYPAPLLDLAGAKVGIVSRGSAAETRMNVILKEVGLEPSDVTYIGVGGVATSIAAFQEGQIDYLQAFPPIGTLLGDGNFELVASQIGDVPENALRSMIFGGQAVTCEFADSHEEEILSYCKSIWDSFDFLNDPANTAAIEQHIADFTALPLDQAEQVWDLSKGAYPTAAFAEEEWHEQALYGSDEFADYRPEYETSVHSCLQSDPR
jgi:ABC-type nitrate/sulfonate/bicarbonate transport system substrate-binding protein